MKTTATLGSNRKIHIFFYGKNNDGSRKYGGDVAISLTNPPGHYIKPCEGRNFKDKLQLPNQDGDIRIWTITKNSGSLRIHVNGVQVRQLKFAESESRADRCPSVYGRTVKMVMFGTIENDTASEEFRARPIRKLSR